MGSSSSGFSMDVTGLYGTGKTISGRSQGGGHAAKGLKEGLDTSSSSIGHHVVKAAMSSFVTDHVIDSANALPVQLESGGHNVSNVSATGRDGDNDGAHRLQTPVADSTSMSNRINRTP